MNYYFILFVLVIFPFTYATLYYLLRFSRYEGAHQLVTFVRKYDSRNLMSCTLHHFEIDIHWRTHFSFHLMKRTCLSSHSWIFFFRWRCSQSCTSSTQSINVIVEASPKDLWCWNPKSQWRLRCQTQWSLSIRMDKMSISMFLWDWFL
jgi:hypothetical protein